MEKETKENKIEEKKNQTNVEPKVEHKHSEKSEKTAEKAKKEEKPKVKKYEAIAFGRSLPISKKHSMYISKFIKNKSIDQAIKELHEVIAYKRAIPFKGEIPHRKGKGMMSGRYPINACHEFINLLKGLKGNVIVAGLDLDKTRVFISSPSWASRPTRSQGRSAKRTNFILKAKEFHIGGNRA